MDFLIPQNRQKYHSSIKKEDPFDKTNHRPISILPLVSKVFEKSIYSQHPAVHESIALGIPTGS